MFLTLSSSYPISKNGEPFYSPSRCKNSVIQPTDTSYRYFPLTRPTSISFL